MADVHQPALTLTAVCAVDYTVTPHHPSLSLSAQGVVNYTVTPLHPSLSLSAQGVVDYTVTEPLLALEGSGDISVTTSGQVFITPPRATPPAGYDVAVRTASFTGGLEITLDRFGRPV